MKNILLFSSFSILLLFSCDKTIEEFDESKYGYDYFPLSVGNTWVYAVDSTIYDDEGATIYNTSSFVQEKIAGMYVDDTGDTIYKLERYWRTSDSMDWEITDVWTTYKTQAQAFRTEENLKFVKFVFPMLEGKRWNGNLYLDETTIVSVSGESLIMFAGWDDYKCTSLDVAEEIGGINYSNVATILQTDDGGNNTVERRYALEKYARGVGLIYKEYEILDTQNSQSEAPWSEKAESGFILKQTLIEHN
ncbi:hypothetical protein [Portibacter lacus]|nr:hypothetical protein [Portibacter lacus]